MHKPSLHLACTHGWQNWLDPACPITQRDRLVVADVREQMMARGHKPVPVLSPWARRDGFPVASAGKRPPMENWQHGVARDALIPVKSRTANTGLILGSPTIAVDVDVE